MYLHGPGSNAFIMLGIQSKNKKRKSLQKKSFWLARQEELHSIYIQIYWSFISCVACLIHKEEPNFLRPISSQKWQHPCKSICEAI